MRFLIIAIMCLSFHWWINPAPNDLLNTKWTGLVNVPDPRDGALEFKKDSIMVEINHDIIEYLSYQVKGDTLLVKKLSGISPCLEETGRYIYRIKDNQLTISVIEDGCTARSDAFSRDGYKKQQN